MKCLIVSRHQAAVDFIRATCPEFVDAPVLASAGPKDVIGAFVAGNLPLHLAALCREVYAVEFSGQAPRGSEYGLVEMRAAGAHVVCYEIFRADLLADAVVEIAEGRNEFARDSLNRAHKTRAVG